MYLTAGKATGEANELVYCQPVSGCPTDYKLSQLIWQIEDVTMLVAGFNASADGITLNVEGRFGVTDGDGVMDDYDWQYRNTDWSDWSHHDDTDVTNATVWDVNLDFSLYDSGNTNLAFVLGYKFEKWGWESRGGTYIYSDTDTLSFRDQSGSFTPGQLVISYEQKFSTPYLGLKFNLDMHSWKMYARYLYSNRVDVSSVDHHYLRNLIFEDTFGDGEMNAYELGMTFMLNDSLGILARYDVQEYKEVRGGTTYRNSVTGAITGYCVNCAGADNSTAMWSLGLSYKY